MSVPHLRRRGKRSRSVGKEHPLIAQMRRRMERIVEEANRLMIPGPGDRVVVHIYTDRYRHPFVLK